MQSCAAGSLTHCALDAVPLLIAILTLAALALLVLRFHLKRSEGRQGRATRPTQPPAPIVPARPQPERPAPPPKALPLQIRISDAPDLKLAQFMNDLRIQGDFASLLTAAILGSQGWKQLPSRYHGDRGIGGLFVREVRGGGGFECLATESLADGAAFNPSIMSDAALVNEIAQLYELGALSRQLAEDLSRTIGEGRSYFRKELWRHDLSSGQTTISELGRMGEKGRSVTRSNARMVSALYLALSSFDREGVYLGRPPVDDQA